MAEIENSKPNGKTKATKRIGKKRKIGRKNDFFLRKRKFEEEEEEEGKNVNHWHITILFQTIEWLCVRHLSSIYERFVMFNFNGCMCARLSLTPFIYRNSSFQKLCEKRKKKKTNEKKLLRTAFFTLQSNVKWDQKPEFSHISRHSYGKIRRISIVFVCSFDFSVHSLTEFEFAWQCTMYVWHMLIHHYY